MGPEDTEFLLSLSKEEAARRLHVRGVALQMKRYQKTRHIEALALLTYGSDKVFDRSIRSLGVSFVTAYLIPSQEHRSVTDALAHCSYPDHTNGQTAAILLANLAPQHVAQTAHSLNVTTDAVETALTLGLAELLDDGQLMMLSIMSTMLCVTIVASRHLRDTAN